MPKTEQEQGKGTEVKKYREEGMIDSRCEHVPRVAIQMMDGKIKTKKLL